MALGYINIPYNTIPLQSSNRQQTIEQVVGADETYALTLAGDGAVRRAMWGVAHAVHGAAVQPVALAPLWGAR